MEVPFVWLRGWWPYAGLGVALITVIVGGVLQAGIARRFLRTPATSSPIADWELAGRKARLDAILASWDGPRRAKAGLTLAIDVPFLVAYGFGLSFAASLGSVTFASYGWDAVACAFTLVAWAALGAAALDAVENILLAWTLRYETGGDSLPLVIAALAKVKFLVALKVAPPFALTGLIVNLLGCRTGCLPG